MRTWARTVLAALVVVRAKPPSRTVHIDGVGHVWETGESPWDSAAAFCARWPSLNTKDCVITLVHDYCGAANRDDDATCARLHAVSFVARTGGGATGANAHSTPVSLIFDEQTDDAAATARKYCRENNCEANVESFVRDEILRTVAHAALARRKRVPVGVDSAAAPSLPHTPKMDSDRRSLRRQFIILSSQRCGSNWLGARLHWHTELAIGGEIQPLIKRARATRLAGAGMPGEDSADDDDDYEMQSFATVDSVDAGDDEYDGVDVDYGNEDLTAQEDDDGPARDGAHATMRVIQRALAHALENNASGPSNSHDNSVYGVKNVAGVRAVGVLLKVRALPSPPPSIAKRGGASLRLLLTGACVALGTVFAHRPERIACRAALWKVRAS